MNEMVRFVAAPDLPPEWQVAWWLVLAIVLVVAALNVVYVLPELVRYVHAAMTERPPDPDEAKRLASVIDMAEYRESPHKGVIS